MEKRNDFNMFERCGKLLELSCGGKWSSMFQQDVLHDDMLLGCCLGLIQVLVTDVLLSSGVLIHRLVVRLTTDQELFWGVNLPTAAAWCIVDKII